MSTLSDRFREMLNETGLNQSQFARRVGMSKQNMTLLLNGTTKTIQLTKAIGIQRKLGYRVEWVSEGRLPKKVTAAQGHISNVIAQPREWSQDWVSIPVVTTTKEVDAMIGQNIEALRMPMSMHVLDALHVAPDHAVFVIVTDDSMAPDIRQGSLCLIDGSRTAIVNGGRFLIEYANERMVRRVFLRYDGALRIAADNDRHAEETIPHQYADQVIVLGQVRMVMTVLGDGQIDQSAMLASAQAT